MSAGALPGVEEPPPAPQQPPPLAPAFAASERQPLLPRASAPTCARCFLCLSGHQLLLALFALFLACLAIEGKLTAWSQSLLLTLTADGFYAGIGVFSGAFTIFALMTANLDRLREQGCCGMTCYFLGLWLTSTLCWHSMLRICALHGLETTCLVSSVCPKLIKGNNERNQPDLSGFLNGLVLCWSWAPTGLCFCLGGMLWQPWHVLCYMLPMAFLGKGTVTEIRWWQWRETLVGAVFWLCTLLVILVSRSRSFANADEADRRFLLVVGASISVIFTTAAFYLTTEPIIGFWSFLLRPWLDIVSGAFQGKLPELSSQEWLAMILMLWGIARVIFIVASVRLEQWSARKRMEETLQEALAHPFRAELEQGFGLAPHPENRGLGVMLSGMLQGNGTPLVREAVNGRLSEKQKALIALRQQSLLFEAGGHAVLPGQLRLHIHREKLLEDTWKALFNRPVSELLAPRISIIFDGESGFDVGGLTRDWFDSVGRVLTERVDDLRGGSLLALAPDQTLIPRPVAPEEDGEVQAAQQEKFRAFMSLGRFMALAVFHEHPLPLSFSLILCKHLLRIPVGMEDVRQLDPEFYQGRVEQVLRQGGLAEIATALGEPLTFVSAPTEFRPVPEDLKPGGDKEVVTEETKTEYVQLLCENHLCGGIRREIQCLLKGFWDVLPLEVMRQCEVGPRELSVLISGVADLDPDDWRQHSEGGTSEVHNWFWEIVKALNLEQRCMLLHFATGSSRLPPGGFADLKPRFTVSVTRYSWHGYVALHLAKVSDTGSSLHLPHAHTCVNQIVLPRYSERVQLKEKLLQALSTEDFGLV